VSLPVEAAMSPSCKQNIGQASRTKSPFPLVPPLENTCLITNSLVFSSSAASFHHQSPTSLTPLFIASFLATAHTHTHTQEKHFGESSCGDFGGKIAPERCGHRIAQRPPVSQNPLAAVTITLGRILRRSYLDRKFVAASRS
jgi:hypothetical protein